MQSRPICPICIPNEAMHGGLCWHVAILPIMNIEQISREPSSSRRVLQLASACNASDMAIGIIMVNVVYITCNRYTHTYVWTLLLAAMNENSRENYENNMTEIKMVKISMIQAFCRAP